MLPLHITRNLFQYNRRAVGHELTSFVYLHVVNVTRSEITKHRQKLIKQQTLTVTDVHYLHGNVNRKTVEDLNLVI